jgi:mono/diheme cytochrome c family protein
MRHILHERKASVRSITAGMVLMGALATVTAIGYQGSPSNRQWPPAVQTVSNESPVLAPAEALKTFYMPPGYHVELMADLTGTNEHDPIGRIVVLEDTNGDGAMDKRTVFADGLVLARSVKVLDLGVLVAEPPNLWLMRDTTGDLRADTKELVSDRFSSRDGDPQNAGNFSPWALDNRIHTAGETDLQFRLKNRAFELQQTLARGEWGVTEDDAGRIYRNTNESALHVDLVPTAYFARNPHLLRTRGSYERLADDNPELNTVWPVRPNPGTNRAYQAGIDRPDGTLAKFTSVCAPLVYRGDRLPAELYGNVFVAEPAANVVSRIVLDDSGDTLRARKGYDRGEFLASTDERFRPVYLSNAPDGTLYVVDMYRGIIEHRISTTTYLRDQILGRKLDRPTGQGRIYRVVHDTTVRDTSRVLVNDSPQNLVTVLSHPNGWRRETAQRLLVERGSRSIAPALVMLAGSAADWRTRLRALWTLDGLDAITPATVLFALEDRSRAVRMSAVRIAERWLDGTNVAVAGAMQRRIDDPDVAVRRQVAASLGNARTGYRETSLTSMLERHGDDPVTMDAALSGLRDREMTVLQALLQAGAQTPQRMDAITMLAATIIRSADETAIHQLFAMAGDGGRPAWTRSALMRGAEVAVLNAATPGARRATPVPVAATDLPCPTCPGGRAGPGGAYAFQRPGDPTLVSRAPRTGPRLRLNREPTALTAMAASNDDLAPRATTLLTGVAWPGKPGEAIVTPLTAEEQRRFDAGLEVYRNICQACHQPDGRGRASLAPSLIASPLALAAGGIPARILLNGKEGSVGLMPPIGSALNDDQIAAVLTYIRRAWGNGATPVEPGLITTVRALTADRARPWTDSELFALPAGSR